MIKRYIEICKKYFKLNANNKKYLIALFVIIFIRITLAIPFPYFASKIVEFVTNKDVNNTLLYIALLAVNYILYNIAYHINFKMLTKNTVYMYNKLQANIVNKISTYDEYFFNKISKSNLINTTSSDIARASVMIDNIFSLGIHLYSVIASILIIFYTNILIGTIITITTIIYLLLVNIYTDKRDYHLSEQRKNQDRIVEVLGQVIDGNKEIKSFDMLPTLNTHFNSIKKSWSRSYLNKRIYYDRKECVLPCIFQVSKILSYIILLIMLVNGNATISILILIIGYLDKAEEKIKVFNNVYNGLCMNAVRIDRIFNILNYKPKNVLQFGKNDNDNILGDIEFKNVNFTYDNDEILNNINLKINRNHITVFVGKSGSGKSTIFKLLLRLYKPSNGEILIDGVNIYNYSKEIYSSNVSIATQKPFIFNMTIRENLSMVDSNHNHQIEACKRVGIHDFIESLPKGYNTLLKEDASDISGGQKQLISIARTILSKSEILLFDEVTSSLDPNTTTIIQKLLKELKKDHTILLITHKPKLMKIADDIVVMNHGKIVGTGNNKELLDSNNYYKELQY